MQSQSPDERRTLQHQVRSITTHSLRLSTATLAGAQEGELASPRMEVKYDPSEDQAKSASIVNEVKDFLLAFDDYNYKQINQHVTEVLRGFKNEYQNPIEHGSGPEFDLSNLDKINFSLEEVKEQPP